MRHAALLTAAVALLATPALAQSAKPRPAAVQPARVAPLNAADQALVDRAAAYLQALPQVQGRFVQTDPRGRTTQGSLYLSRPGRARFAYDAPAEKIVVADGMDVNVYDKRLKTFEKYPQKLTPLNLLLARQGRLDRTVQVSDVRRYAEGFSLTLRDGRREAEGKLVLAFGDKSGVLSLREWSAIDGQGGTTRVRLSYLKPAPGLDKALFKLADPRPRRITN